MNYIAAGLTLLDRIILPDGTALPPKLGGAPLYGYSALRMFTDSVTYVTRVGRDYDDFFGPWLRDNNVDRSGFRVVSEEMPACILNLNEAGDLVKGSFFTGDWKDADYYRPRAEDFDGLLDGVRGVYLASGPPPEAVWDGMLKLRDRHGFRLMWEPINAHTYAEDKEAIDQIVPHLDMASFSLKEGKRIFGVETEEELLERLKGYGIPLILLRLGERGLYVLHKGKTVLVPPAPLPSGASVVDVVGCGNSSTAAACYAWCEGKDPAMTGIMANIAASYNLRQYGPTPRLSGKLMGEVVELADRLYRGGAYREI